MCDRPEFGEADTWLLRVTKRTNCLTIPRQVWRAQCAAVCRELDYGHVQTGQGCAKDGAILSSLQNKFV